MAKINFGTTINDARGKLNGTVFSKNKSGAYMRKKVTPANPNTPTQSARRDAFSGLSKAWSGTLTDVERAAWKTYAQTYPRLDIFGASITLSGINMFISLNQVLLTLPAATINSPPPSNVVTPIAFDPLSLVATVSGQNIVFDETAAAASADVQFYVFGTRALPAGRAPQRNDFRFIGGYAGVAGPYPKQIDISDGWVALFGSFAAGQRIALLVATVDVTTGLTTVGTILQSIAA